MIEVPARGLLFDCDGVLVDSLPSAGVAWNRWAETYAPSFEFFRDMVQGRRSSEMIATLVAPEIFDEADRRLVEMEIELTVDIPPIPGAETLLPSLPDGGWAVVTSGGRELATARLRSAGLPVPPAMITAGDVANGKPNPEPYLKGAALLGLDPVDCIVFEDATAGVLAALAAGVGLVVGVGPEIRGTGAHVFIDDLRAVSCVDGMLRIDASRR